MGKITVYIVLVDKMHTVMNYLNLAVSTKIVQ